MTAKRRPSAELTRLRKHADLLADLCEGVLGADDNDAIGTIRVHFSDRPSLYIRTAMAMALDEYRAAAASAPSADPVAAAMELWACELEAYESPNLGKFMAAEIRRRVREAKP